MSAQSQVSAPTAFGSQLAVTLQASTRSLRGTLAAATAEHSMSIGFPAASVSGQARLVNLSVRTRAGSGDETLIAGFVISGTGTKQLLIRGLGPTLSKYGVSGPLSDPQLRIFNGATRNGGNDNWGGGGILGQVFDVLGAAPLDRSSKDAALLQRSSPGVYSAHVVSAVSAGGIALAEIYDAEKNGARLVNVSARSVVRTGEDILVAGFVLEGSGSTKLLIRALGPTLTSLGVSGALPRAELKVYNSAGQELAQNRTWGGTSALKAAFATVGAAPLVSDSSDDAAVVVTLVPGVYSVQVSGVDNTTGVALVEIYEVR